ncbi:MAG: hypothetical protein AAGL24_16605 [Pseudomonadota bacterium]
MLNVFARLLALGLLLALGTATLHASAIKGADDPRFESALSTWLDGQDMNALRTLAALAREDNRAAQILLAQIQNKIWLHDHVTSGLDRKQRIELLREPKGLSGRSWLVSAAEDTPLAAYLFDARKPYETPEIGNALLAAGELDAALPLVGHGFMYGDALGSLELALHEKAIPYMSGLANLIISQLPELEKSGWFSADDPRFDQLRERLADLPANNGFERRFWGAAAVRDLQPGSREFRDLGADMVAMPAMQPLVDIVRRHCPNDSEGALAALQRAYPGIPLSLSLFSPVESLLPTARYRTSTRFEKDILRRIDHDISDATVVRNADACAFDMLASARP